MHINQEESSYLKKMSIFSLSNFILLMSINTSGLIEKCTKTTRQIFIPIIRMDNFDRGIKLGLNHAVKYWKNIEHLTYLLTNRPRWSEKNHQ